MTAKDLVLVASEVVPEFRGKGINPAMIRHILVQVKRQGFVRAFIACATWNKANLRSIRKTSFKPYATSHEYRILGRYITSWKASQFRKRIV